MAEFVRDTFTDSADVAITSHTGETGATWTAQAGSTGTSRIAPSGVELIGAATTLDCLHYASGTSAGADYDVEITWWFLDIASKVAGVDGRVATGADTRYRAIYNGFTLAWELWKHVAGVPTELGTRYGQTLTDYTNYVLRLNMVGTAIKLYVDGVERVSATDGAVTAAGKAGVELYGIGTDTSGPRITIFTATDIGGGGGGGGTVSRRMLMGCG